MAHSDRLTALDAGFLHLERGGAHMHVASILVFVGDPPGYDELVGALDARLHLVPRYRQKLAHVPLGQGRPVWVDDPHFNVRYHVRHSALPEPGSDEQLKRLAARQFARPLDRTKPLWELSLVEGLEGATRFAIVAKTHHALVDGVSGVDVTSVLFDTAPDPTPPAREPRRWVPRPEPADAELLAQALLERATVPAEAARNLRALTRAPRRALAEAGERLVGLGAMAWAGMRPAPPTPFNVPIGPHRRYTWVDADLPRFKAIKDALGGTLNDAVLAAVALALGRFLRRRGEPTDGVVLKAMVPVSVRADAERGALGNRVAAMWAPLPVAERDPQAVFAEVSEAMRGLKESGQAVGAVALTSLADFAPPTILSQAARLQARQRLFNLVVTNVPGPQVPLYLLGRRLERFYPVVPLARNQALGIAIMSYDGRLGFGLLGDYDAMPDLEALAHDLERAIADLERAAGVAGRGSTRAAGRSSTPPRRAPAGGR
ncbi:MAG: diacylglycerol O-acyltransferase / wax synthase [Solirubrobacteraceae bacterium]|jgi:WS/DGAT/MGAT family acyltransferase|nr:diacylglycerol O-acyltransferase / wax synthase [Solirubrobacteraceae bacterium]